MSVTRETTKRKSPRSIPSGVIWFWSIPWPILENERCNIKEPSYKGSMTRTFWSRSPPLLFLLHYSLDGGNRLILADTPRPAKESTIETISAPSIRLFLYFRFPQNFPIVLTRLFSVYLRPNGRRTAIFFPPTDDFKQRKEVRRRSASPGLPATDTLREERRKEDVWVSEILEEEQATDPGIRTYTFRKRPWKNRFRLETSTNLFREISKSL